MTNLFLQQIWRTTTDHLLLSLILTFHWLHCIFRFCFPRVFLFLPIPLFIVIPSCFFYIPTIILTLILNWYIFTNINFKINFMFLLNFNNYVSLTFLFLMVSCSLLSRRKILLSFFRISFSIINSSTMLVCDRWIKGIYGQLSFVNKTLGSLFPAVLLIAPNMLLFIINLKEKNMLCNMNSLWKAILEYK